LFGVRSFSSTSSLIGLRLGERAFLFGVLLVVAYKQAFEGLTNPYITPFSLISGAALLAFCLCKFCARPCMLFPRSDEWPACLFFVLLQLERFTVSGHGTWAMSVIRRPIYVSVCTKRSEFFGTLVGQINVLGFPRERERERGSKMILCTMITLYCCTYIQ